MSEIEAFPRAVLKHHYPDTPLHGDFTTIQAAEYGPIDVLVGGTPCQSFSIAGLRGGLADERGNLALEYIRLVDRLRPRWVVWENVPGVLSSAGGRDFGAFLGGLGECGYGWSYRVLDAQYFGLTQRRKRVFVVGCLGDWRGPAQVLAIPDGLRGHPAPRRTQGEGTSHSVAGSLTGNGDAHSGFKDEHGLIAPTLEAGTNRTGGTRPPGTTVDTIECLVAHSLRADGFDASEDGTGRGTPLVAFAQNQRDEVREMDVAGALASRHGMKQQTYVNTSMVRRLTPTECARLQGFQDDYLDIAFRGKPAADGNKYRALGNSMAVPCIQWIGRHIMEAA
jgi:DNA (cytosine-5)-methyltransferase 1